MSALEIETFRLRTDVTDESFLALDEKLLAWRYLNRPGLQRRTTAHAADGEWLIDTWWDSAARAQDPEVDELAQQWTEMIDQSSYQRRIYRTLD